MTSKPLNSFQQDIDAWMTMIQRLLSVPERCNEAQGYGNTKALKVHSKLRFATETSWVDGRHARKEDGVGHGRSYCERDEGDVFELEAT